MILTEDKTRSYEYRSFIRKFFIPILIILILIPAFYTGSHTLLPSKNPEGVIDYPDVSVETSDGFLLIILDGVGRDIMLDSEYMPFLNSQRGNTALINLETGPLTLSANCVKEMMTGVPNAPIDGLNNFKLPHPGGEDPWLLAADDDRYSVGMIGSYVMGNMYSEFENIEFIDTFRGHSDYYEGDNESFNIFNQWLDNKKHNVISLHFSGSDKVGHTWGILGDDFKDKVLDLDSKLESIFSKVPPQWNIIVTADHGLTDAGTHGSAEEVTRRVSAFVKGPNIAPGSQSEGHQRDLSALTTFSLNLPFPEQLHGKIPLEILDLNANQKNIIESWNWQAAYERQIFLDKENGKDSNLVGVNTIEWEKIIIDGSFSRTSDVILSLVVWSTIILISLIYIGETDFKDRNILKNIIMFSTLIFCLILSQKMLNFSAMISRAIGAFCAVWLISWSLMPKFENKNKHSKFDMLKISNKLGQISSNQFNFFALFVLILIFTGTVTQALVSCLMIWIIIYSLSSNNNKDSINNKYFLDNPLLIFIICFTFASLRLWFTLIPFTVICALNLREFIADKKSRIEITSLTITLSLLIISLLLVHDRIFEKQYLMSALRSGWPETIFGGIKSIVILCSAYFLSLFLQGEKLTKYEKTQNFNLLLLGILALSVESNLLDRILLCVILFHYLGFMYYNIFSRGINFSRSSMINILSLHLLLIWGVWASTLALILIPIISPLVNSLTDKFDLDKDLSKNHKLLISMAVIPWVIWIFWWTLMGQVNGVQTCFEGICPHPRELDPGRVMVKGGYVGIRENPPTNWMIFMVGLPILIFSTFMMYEIRKNGILLSPYVVSQLLLILGCVNILAFSAEYPRLIFTLSWNILFAVLQIIFALLAMSLHRYLENKNVEIKISC